MGQPVKKQVIQFQVLKNVKVNLKHIPHLHSAIHLSQSHQIMKVDISLLDTEFIMEMDMNI